ncbi:MAG: aminotransferase class I/II-fold pyridoxal phosphate-dependent enzyme [Planctomycetota bacterium]
MHPWLAERTNHFDSSGIRKVFDLAAKLENPINLSIGQPDFPAPEPVKQAAVDAILADKNGYSVTQGAGPLVERLQADVDRLGHADRRVLVTSGASGALVLAMLALVDPGDEVICFDPYFVMYPTLCGMVGGRAVKIDTYPRGDEDRFTIDVDRVAAAITPRTKAIVLGSPGNPTGAVATADEVRGLAELAAERNIALLSDEIYSRFVYDGELASPTTWNDQAIVVDAFSKSHALTGWRLGYVHGPSAVIEKMTMLQQYTFVCAPHPLQWGAVAAADTDVSAQMAEYRERRDRVVAGLREAGYKTATPGGAFYVFPEVPPAYESGAEFAAKAVEHEMLVIPGGIFSDRDTHFRISFAASMETIDRGLEVLRAMAR